ncbi:MAG: fructose-1,6-bisphosphate aldolase/phosphatase [Thermoleophilia bacterium]
MITLSVIKADVGGYVGHADVHEDLLARAQEEVAEGVASGLLVDAQVQHVGDDIALVMTHERGEDSVEIHEFAWDTFVSVTEVARELKMYGAGQDLLAEGFTGNVKGLGPGCAEIEFEERTSEPVIVFLADKTEPGAWNLPLYKIFCDPFNTAGLVIDPKMHDGFEIEVHDVVEHKKVVFSCPAEIYDLLVFIGAQSRYVIKRVRSKGLGEVAAATSTERLNLTAGRYIGKDDPVMIVRCQSGLPAVGEVLEPWANPHLVFGWMRGSHCGPLMPCSMKAATPSRFDGPPRVIGLGYQLTGGRLIGPRDMLGDISFDRARAKALEMADYMRSMGPFEPQRLPLEDMEYTTLPQVEERLRDRFEPLVESLEV